MLNLIGCFGKREDRKPWLCTGLTFGESRKVCSMKERGRPRRASIYVQLFSVSRPAKEGHSPIMYILQSFNLCSQKHAISDSGSCSKCFYNMRFCSCCLEAREVGGRNEEEHMVILATSFDSFLGRSIDVGIAVLENRRTGEHELGGVSLLVKCGKLCGMESKERSRRREVFKYFLPSTCTGSWLKPSMCYSMTPEHTSHVPDVVFF